MRKLISLIFTLAFMLLVVGCSQNADSQVVNESDPVPNKWGISLEVDNVTNVGLTLVCQQSGGENVAELDTGSYYIIQKLEKTGWVDVEFAPQEYDVAWTSEAWIIQKESMTTWDVNWEWLYGRLPAGEYRIGKEIMNFRGAGDFDQEMVYATFTIE